MSKPKTPSAPKTEVAQPPAPPSASEAPRTTVAPVPLPPSSAVRQAAGARRGRGPLCSICKSPMINNGVRRMNHPFVVRVTYKCSKDGCCNTSVVEERRR